MVRRSHAPCILDADDLSQQIRQTVRRHRGGRGQQCRADGVCGSVGPMKRRTLLQSLATLLFTGPLARVTLRGQAAATATAARTVPTLTQSHITTLNAVAEVVLPGAIGAAARRAAVDRFVQWVKDYREG